MRLDCQLPCDEDCEAGPSHCWNLHRPSHKPDWHNPRACDAVRKTAPCALCGRVHRVPPPRRPGVHVELAVPS